MIFMDFDDFFTKLYDFLRIYAFIDLYEDLWIYMIMNLYEFDGFMRILWIYV